MERSSYRLLWGAIALAVLAALALTWGRPERAAAEPGGKIHPAVEAFRDQHPGDRVPVIVRLREGAGGAASPLAAAAGPSQPLPLVDGFAATLSPREIDAFARSPDVELVALDAVVVTSDRGDTQDFASGLATAYPFAANAVPAWEQGVTGAGITVAVIDSGISGSPDFRARLVGRLNFNDGEASRADLNGHGTHVAGVIGGSDRSYVGIAPGVDLLSVKVAGEEGAALTSDVIEALQWVVDHRDEYAIRVVNISLTSSLADSYRLDPLDAAVEEAWFRGIVVVAAAGNFGGEPFALDHAPANDPYVITVGAFSDAGTAETGDDRGLSWSGQGLTVDGFAKPEVRAPGENIVSALSSRGAYLARSLPQALVDARRLSLSGTSASAAVVSGVVALMLQRQPELSPDQVKFRLMQTGRPLDGAAAAPAVDAFAAVFTTQPGEANQYAAPSDLIDPQTGEVMYDSVLWRSVLWRSVLWRSVLWSSVLWRK